MTELVKAEGSAKVPHKGRQKGSKNKTTIFREAVQDNMQTLLHEGAEELLNLMFDQALGRAMDSEVSDDGEVVLVPAKPCKATQKILFDKLMANAKPAEADGEKPTVVVNVHGPAPAERPIEGVTVEVTKDTT